jgi:hypothetical protein
MSPERTLAQRNDGVVVPVCVPNRAGGASTRGRSDTMVNELPMTHRARERGRVVAQGRCTDTNERGSLLAIHETAGTWVFYPPIGERGVRLSAEDAIRVAEKILADARDRS